LSGNQRGRSAHTEPVWQVSGGTNLADSLVQTNQLNLGDGAVGLVGGKQVGHDAFQAQRRAGGKSLQNGAQRARFVHVGFEQRWGNPLAAHAGVNLQMHRDRASRSASRPRRVF
jgi:hypothetical protein